MKVVVALPAYNEEESLPALLDSVRSVFSGMDYDCGTLVVDDGSSDGTVDVVKDYACKMPIDLVEHGVNKGLGAAMQTLFRETRHKLSSEDVVVTMDADNTHDPSLIPEMAEIVRTGFDVVVASRYAPGGDEVGLALHRKILSRGASTFLKCCFTIPGVRDCSCGYRAYNINTLHRASSIYGDRLVEETGFVCMAEILVKLAMIGARMVEVPLVLRYDLKSGASKMKVTRTIGQYFKLARRKGELMRAAGTAMSSYVS